MPDIEPPRFKPAHRDYDSECEEALGLAFQDLMMKAEAAGWRPDRVAAALLALGVANMKGHMADAATHAIAEFLPNRDGKAG